MPKTKNQVRYPEFFERYIRLVDPEMELLDLLKQFLPLYRDQLPLLKSLKDRVYASGKWTAKQIIQHITDNERIQSTRLLRIARGEKIALPGYDQDVLAQNARVNHRSLESMIDEFELSRQNTISLVSVLDEEELSRMGNCSSIDLMASDLGFQMVGHQIHHQNVLEERYLPILKH